MRIIDFILEKDIDKTRILAGEIFCGAEPRVHVGEGVIRDERYIFRIVLADRHAYFHVGIQLTVRDIGAPRGGRGQCICLMVISVLPSLTLVLKCTESKAYLNAALAIVEPTIGDIDLNHFGIIAEAVMVVVEGLEIAGDVAEQDGAPFVAHLQG